MPPDNWSRRCDLCIFRKEGDNGIFCHSPLWGKEPSVEPLFYAVSICGEERNFFQEKKNEPNRPIDGEDSHPH